MAKTTSTTKAKTKTTKRKPTVNKSAKTTTPKTTAVKAASKAKATSKTAAARTKKAASKTTAKVTKPVAATKSTATAKVNARTTETRFSFLNRAQVTIGAIFSLLAVFAGYFVNTESAQVLMGHLAKDELASKAGTVLAPAAAVLYEVEFRWLLVVLLATAAVIAYLRGTRYYALEEEGLKARVQRSRWIEFGITGALMFEIVALLNGLQDVVALKLGIVSILVAAWLAWIYERENAVTNKPSRAIYGATVALIVVPIVALVTTMLSTYIYSDVRSAWYAYAAAAVVSLGLVLTVRHLRSVAKGSNGVSDYFFADRKYNLISVGTKVALAAILITGLLK